MLYCLLKHNPKSFPSDIGNKFKKRNPKKK